MNTSRETRVRLAAECRLRTGTLTVERDTLAGLLLDLLHQEDEIVRLRAALAEYQAAAADVLGGGQ